MKKRIFLILIVAALGAGAWGLMMARRFRVDHEVESADGQESEFDLVEAGA